MSWFQVARRTSHYKISMSAFSRLSTRIVKQTNKQTNWEIRQTWQLILRWSFQKLDFFISEIQLDKAWSYLHCFDGWDILKAVFTEAKQNIETYVTRKKKKHYQFVKFYSQFIKPLAGRNPDGNFLLFDQRMRNILTYIPAF